MLQLRVSQEYFVTHFNTICNFQKVSRVAYDTFRLLQSPSAINGPSVVTSGPVICDWRTKITSCIVKKSIRFTTCNQLNDSLAAAAAGVVVLQQVSFDPTNCTHDALACEVWNNSASVSKSQQKSAPMRCNQELQEPNEDETTRLYNGELVVY